MTGFDLAVHREADTGYRAEPDVVVTLSVALKTAIIGQENLF
jgi:hypothetical protein